MNKIIIDPHYCSEAEYEQLKDYLSSECWDYTEIPTSFHHVDNIKSAFDTVIDIADEIIDTMPLENDKEGESQRICLQNNLNQFSYAVNGIEASDLIPENEDEDEDEDED